MGRKRITYRAIGLHGGLSKDTVRRFLLTTNPVEVRTVWAIEEAMGFEHDLLLRTLAGQTTIIAAMDMADADLQRWILGQLEIAGAARPDLRPGAWLEAASG